MVKNRKIPLRKCVITGEQLPKKDLIRVVKNKELGVLVDPTGKVNGRGAYIKRDKAVIEKARKSKKLDKHLEAVVEYHIYTALLEQISE